MVRSRTEKVRKEIDINVVQQNGFYSIFYV